MEFKDKVIINKKRVKNISIRIRDGKVLVSAPLNIDDTYLVKLLESKKDWIIEKLSENREEKISEFLNRDTIKEGEVIKYLGKDYIVKIQEKSNGGIILDKDKIIINCYKKENAIDLLKKFYKTKINEVFQEVLSKLEKETGLIPLKITIKFMSTRWGSCNKAKRTVNLNGELIKKREKAIEYVVLHELCHLVHANHSKSFYDLVKKYMNDYREEEIYLNGK